MNNLTTLEQEIFDKFSRLESKENLEKFKIEILGKKGTLSKLFQDLATIEKEKKKAFASQLNILKTKVLEQFNILHSKFEQEEIQKKIRKPDYRY